MRQLLVFASKWRKATPAIAGQPNMKEVMTVEEKARQTQKAQLQGANDLEAA
ncbi:hypothetical protein [Deinococcus deserti]|uniref:hypothetical protein n=1 Tax=Deinococcus deserti TaxID=310783 RepID=UPI0002F7A98E|nr:hypothetical protein [Deinococcus deserti]